MILCDGVVINTKVLLFKELLSIFIDDMNKVSNLDMFLMSNIIDDKDVQNILTIEIINDNILKESLKKFIDYYILKSEDVNLDIVKYYGNGRILNGRM